MVTRTAGPGACVALLAASGVAAAQGVRAAPPHLVGVGARAPDFTLLDAHWTPVRLSDAHGKRDVILVFHVVAFSPHCATELQAYQRALRVYRRARPARLDGGPVVLGINMESPYGNAAFATRLGITFPLLSDLPAAVRTAYGVRARDARVDTSTYQWPEHATVLMDRTGVVRYVVTGDAAMDPGPVFDALRALPPDHSANVHSGGR